MTLILSRRPWSTTVAVTFPPSRYGAPIFTSSPSPTISTWSSSTVAPFSASIFSTFNTSPVVARYCLPPVLNTAYIRFPAPFEKALQKGGNVSCFEASGQPRGTRALLLSASPFQGRGERRSARNYTLNGFWQSLRSRSIVGGLDS